MHLNIGIVTDCFFLSISISLPVFQSPELEYRRHGLMGRLHKLEADIELDVLPAENPHIVSQSSIILNSNQHSPSSTTTDYDGTNGLNYNNNNNNPLMINHNLINNGSSGGLHNSVYETSYGKEVYFGMKNKEMVCGEPMDESFLRPPLWEDITSSIQNIDPENAMMLANLPSATQVSCTCPVDMIRS